MCTVKDISERKKDACKQFWCLKNCLTCLNILRKANFPLGLTWGGDASVL